MFYRVAKEGWDMRHKVPSHVTKYIRIINMYAYDILEEKLRRL